MTAILGSLVASAWPYILAGLAALLGLWKAYSAGKSSERSKQDRARLDAIKAKKEKDDEVNSLAPADLDARFKRWMHDDKR